MRRVGVQITLLIKENFSVLCLRLEFTSKSLSGSPLNHDFSAELSYQIDKLSSFNST